MNTGVLLEDLRYLPIIRPDNSNGTKESKNISNKGHLIILTSLAGQWMLLETNDGSKDMSSFTDAPMRGINATTTSGWLDEK